METATRETSKMVSKTEMEYSNGLMVTPYQDYLLMESLEQEVH